MQETLLAALAGEASFAGRSNLRTWLTGILKHKIVDAIRRMSREPPAARGETTSTPCSTSAATGSRCRRPGPTPTPSLDQKQFFAVLEDCLAKLPAKTSQAFMMREHMGLETDEICKELAITPTHCWVLLHRARLALRDVPGNELVRQDMMLSCKEAARLVSQRLDRELGFGERVMLRVHLTHLRRLHQLQGPGRLPAQGDVAPWRRQLLSAAPRCGAPFHCGAEAGEASCWCESLPAVDAGAGSQLPVSALP